MKILVGVDESPFSAAAVKFVTHMKWPEGTEIRLISAVQPLAGSYAMVEMPVPVAAFEEASRELRVARQESTAVLEREVKASGYKSNAKVVTGDARFALVDAARSENADLLVVGSHGRTGLTKLMLGSVASHVVTHAPCSVLVVKTPPAPNH
jgi:nucleotide-binding universal stress UspA family protein